MIRQNMGRLDRALRFGAGVTLILVGLLALGGWKGDAAGLAVVALALVPLATSITGFCPAYVPFGISTRSGTPRPDREPAAIGATEARPR